MKQNEPGPEHKFFTLGQTPDRENMFITFHETENDALKTFKKFANEHRMLGLGAWMLDKEQYQLWLRHKSTPTQWMHALHGRDRGTLGALRMRGAIGLRPLKNVWR